MAVNETEFLEMVQLHERVWGEDHYPFRPTMIQMLESPVVTFWRPINRKKDDRYTARLYTDLKEIEAMYTQMLFRSHVQPAPPAVLARVYVHRERYIVRAVRILFTPFHEAERR